MKIRRLSDEERLDPAKFTSWREIEEWKATAETLEDKPLMRRIRQGLKDEAHGRMRPVSLGWSRGPAGH
jgi:hypothetical protein